MGCDIHDFAELKLDGAWQKVGEVFPNPYHDKDSPPSRWNAPLIDHPFHSRCYQTFAVLAGVRNYDEAVPISPPRGIPEDVSPGVLKEYTLVVDEVRAVDGGLNEEGFVSLPTAQRWVASGSSRWIVEGRVVTDPDAHSESWLSLRDLLSHRWGRKVKAEGLWDRTIPALLRLIVPPEKSPEFASFLESIRAGKRGAVAAVHDRLLDFDLPSLDDVRMVFWFDN